MKKYLLLFLSIIIFSSSFSFSVIKPAMVQADKVFIFAGKNGARLSLLEVSKISIKDYQRITGQHLNFFERLNFKAAQKKIRKNISADGTVNSKILSTNSFGDSFSGFNLGGFLLGLFLFLPGVLIAYLIGGEDEDIRRSRVKWAWYGAGLFVVIALAVFRS
ncbi:MAG: hypothetical protein ACR2KX_14025 [Chitinophagaceae bacterium]